MAEDGNGARTHEPNLRELTAELDGLRAVFETRMLAAEKLAEERDKWYSERDRDRQGSIDKALTAAKEQTTASFVASEKAIVKAEDAQKAYNVAHNDLARKMDEQNKATMPRTETENRFRTHDEKITDIRTAMAAGGGVTAGGQSVKNENRANIGIMISLILLALAILKASGKL